MVFISSSILLIIYINIAKSLRSFCPAEPSGECGRAAYDVTSRVMAKRRSRQLATAMVR
jgi:hypothetical protein